MMNEYLKNYPIKTAGYFSVSFVFKIDLDIKDDDDKLRQQRYEILVGEYESGNTSPQNKNELKRYIVEALAEGKISRSNAYLILYQLSL